MTINNNIVPTRPVGDSSGAAASTAFVATVINDQSTVVGSLAQFYKPTYFGHPGSAVVERFNRVQVGEAALTSQDVLSSTVLPTTPSWADTLINVQFISLGQVSSVAAWGNAAFCGAARTSDYTAAGLGSSGGTAGANLCGYNDGGGIAYGLNTFGIRKSGITGVTLGSQTDINNGGSVVDLNPFGTIANGVTFAALLTAGAYAIVATANPTAAIVLGAGATTRFRKGILVMSPALDTSVGAGGAGVVMEVPRNVSWRIINSGSGTDTEFWGNASGLTINSAAVVAAGITTGANSGTGGSLTLNGATSGSATIGVAATAGTLQFNGTNATIDSAGNLIVPNLAVTSSIFRTQAPATLSGTSGAINSSTQIINPSNTFTLTLLSAAFSGQWQLIKTIANFAVNSASSNVVPLAGGAAGTAILSNTAGKWAILISDGTNWNIVAAN
jgi:hypothetical protein